METGNPVVKKACVAGETEIDTEILTLNFPVTIKNVVWSHKTNTTVLSVDRLSLNVFKFEFFAIVVCLMFFLTS